MKHRRAPFTFSRIRPLLSLALMLACAVIGGIGCSSTDKAYAPRAQADMMRGDFAPSRVWLADNLTQNKNDRNYLIDRIRLMMLTLADGYPHAGETVVDEVYSTLRTQGINRDRTVAAVVINEDLKLWKGEPFEQAMSFCYVGYHYAIQGDWGNLRAAAENSLFYLRDFVDEGARDNMQYQPVESNFTLGYMLHGVSSWHLGQRKEAELAFNKAVAYNGALAPLVERLKAGNYNTLLVVDHGSGPHKVLEGPDGSISRYHPRTRSDDTPIHVAVTNDSGARDAATFPQVIDLNPIAQDLRWNSLETVRQIKSTLGEVMMVGGGITAASARDSDTRNVGLAILAAGLFARAGAHADPRYLDVLPQSVYLVPLNVNSSDDRIELQAVNHRYSKLVLTDLAPPAGPTPQLRYVRLPNMPSGSPGWATSGNTHYGNVYNRRAGDSYYPYILGGDDVQPPSAEALLWYRQYGYLPSLTPGELMNLYAVEGLETSVPKGTQPGRHILEGGNSLVAPIPGSTGYARIFGQKKRPYTPKAALTQQLSREVVQINQRISAPAQ